MFIKEISDRVKQVKKNRGKSLRRKKAGILGLGVALGAVAGAATGILYAPKAGKDTREELSRRGGEAWGKIKESASATGHKVASAVEEKYSHIRSAPNESVHEGLESVKKFEGKEV